MLTLVKASKSGHLSWILKDGWQRWPVPAKDQRVLRHGGTKGPTHKGNHRMPTWLAVVWWEVARPGTSAGTTWERSQGHSEDFGLGSERPREQV